MTTPKLDYLGVWRFVAALAGILLAAAAMTVLDSVLRQGSPWAGSPEPASRRQWPLPQHPMPYYATIEEDIQRAKQILAEGKAALDTQLDILIPDPDVHLVRQRIHDLQGGTIFGKDLFAAYKLLESFVEELERRRA